MRWRDQGWRTRAACEGAPLEVFFSSVIESHLYEETYPPPEAQAYCDRCPVRTECLDDAQDTHDIGIRGGTTAYQRRALRRRYGRAHCPVCASRLVVPVAAGELCASCGASWTVTHDVRPGPPGLVAVEA